MINCERDMSGDYRFEQDSFYAYKARVDHARVSGCNYHPNGPNKTYTTPEGVAYTYYYDVQGSTSAVGAGSAGAANKNNQFTAVHIPGSGQLSRGSFYWLQPQTLLLPGGSQVTLSYDDFLQVKERILQDPEQENVAQALYDYDAVGDITAIDTEHGQYSFDYDSLYRLTDADYDVQGSTSAVGAGSAGAAPLAVAANDESFDYDGVGNRTGHTQTPEEGEAEEIAATYNSLNQLVSQTKDGVETTFTYNTNGHTATKTTGSETTEYIYNVEERLIAVKKNGATVGEYAYNPLGQRIKKTVNGQTTWYLYNDEGLAAEYNQQGQLIAEYQFTPYSTWMTDPLFQRKNGQVYYYQNDHLGTPQRMVSAAGDVVWEARYEAFGEVEIINGAVTNNLRFPGQYFDGETGLHHNYFRDYDPGVGRYVQSDPIGILGGINFFVYAKNSPLALYDSYGLYTLGDAKRSLSRRGVPKEGRSRSIQGAYTKEQIFDEWLRLERQDMSWLDEVPDCPKSLDECRDDNWDDVRPANSLHEGAVYEMRSKPTPGGHSAQCSYDGNGNLMTNTDPSSEFPEAPGSADFAACPNLFQCVSHTYHDVVPYWAAKDLGRVDDYYSVRPVK